MSTARPGAGLHFAPYVPGIGLGKAVPAFVVVA